MINQKNTIQHTMQVQANILNQRLCIHALQTVIASPRCLKIHVTSLNTKTIVTWHNLTKTKRAHPIKIIKFLYRTQYLLLTYNEIACRIYIASFSYSIMCLSIQLNKLIHFKIMKSFQDIWYLYYVNVNFRSKITYQDHYIIQNGNCFFICRVWIRKIWKELSRNM